jgi:hypothetical protein
MERPARRRLPAAVATDRRPGLAAGGLDLRPGGAGLVLRGAAVSWRRCCGSAGTCWLAACCGRLFSTGESLALAASGLLISGMAALGLSFIQAPILQASAGRWEAGIDPADRRPLPLQTPAARVFDMPASRPGCSARACWRQRGCASSGSRGAPAMGFSDTQGLTVALFCRQGQDLHLLWSSREEAPRLRVHFRDAHGELVHATWDAASIAPGKPEPFVVGFREDGLDLPVPVARSRASLSLAGAGGQPVRDLLDRLQVGESAQTNCMGPAYRRRDWQREGPIQGSEPGVPPARRQAATGSGVQTPRARGRVLGVSPAGRSAPSRQAAARPQSGSPGLNACRPRLRTLALAAPIVKALPIEPGQRA